MFKPKTVLIGTSLGEESDAIVRTGVEIARAAGATAWLVHAYMPPAFLPEFGTLDRVWIEEQGEVLTKELDAQARRTGLADLPGFASDRLRLAIGAPYRNLVELAGQIHAGLIVVGASEVGALRHFLGSTADGVMRKALCPVLVVRPGAAFPPIRVEIPVDLSPVAAQAVRTGLDFLTLMGVKPIETEVLFVLNPLELAGSIHFTPEQIERFAKDELNRFLEVNGWGAGSGVAHVRTGYPREEILGALEERRVDLAVLGTHGRKGFERLMLGSVAAAVAHHATCNLLIVPPAAVPVDEVVRDEAEALTGADWSFVADQVPA